MPVPLGSDDKEWPNTLVAVLDEAFRVMAATPIAPSHNDETAADEAIGVAFEEVASIEVATAADVLVIFSCAVEMLQQAGVASDLTLRIQRDGSDVWAAAKVLGLGLGSETLYGTVNIAFVDAPGGGAFKWDADMKSSSGTWTVRNVSLFVLELRG